MSDSDNKVRVFISSTFKDMHAERDHLVTVVFPELRERCERLGLEFFDVDDSPQLDAFFVGFDNDAKRLREAYDVSLYDAPAGSCGQRVLKLVPKKTKTEDEALSQPYREIRLYLRNDDLLPCKIEAISDEETSFVMQIDHYEINAAGETPSIRFHVPDGTKIIVNETDIVRIGAGGKDLPDQFDYKYFFVR